MKDNEGLSLFGLLIVTVILGVVARVSVTGLAEGSTQGKVSELIEGLQAMRTGLVVYRAEHRDRLPAIESFELFEMAMTTKVGTCGPCLERIPTNPFNGLKTVRFDGEPAGCNEAGWRLDTKTGLIQADDMVGHAAM